MPTEIESRATTQTIAGEGHETLTPYIMHDRAPELAEFVKQAYGAEELLRAIGSAGGFHIEVQIGDSKLMIGGGGAAKIDTPTPTSLHLYVPDADAVYSRALQAGATSIEEPVDQSYGDREAGVRDLAGNNWFIATRQGPTYIPEGLRAVTPFLHPKGADEMIHFLKQAFDAEEIAIYRSPEGAIVHGTVKIGNSVIEMGEAHGPWQPMPTAFFLSVRTQTRHTGEPWRPAPLRSLRLPISPTVTAWAEYEIRSGTSGSSHPRLPSDGTRSLRWQMDRDWIVESEHLKRHLTE
jgi:uncharacterized glyoxalase superfamily protein PhnB